MAKPITEPLEIFEFSIFRSLTRIILFLTFAIIIILWWLDSLTYETLLVPVACVLCIVAISFGYGWVTRNRAKIEVYQEGIIIRQEFITWDEISKIDYIKTEIDGMAYSLVITKVNDISTSTELNFLNEDSSKIYQKINSVYQLYSTN